MVGEPRHYVRVFVSGVVFEDGEDHLAGWHRSLDGRDEADEFLMPVAGYASIDYLAFEHAEGGKQGRGAVALVIMGHRCALAPLHGQAGLGTVEGLDLALLVDRHHHRMTRRVHVEADDIARPGGELGIGRVFECPDPMWLKFMGRPDALNDAER